jgi:putative MFS transporter
VVVAPALLGALSTRLGSIGAAAALLGIGAWVAIPLIWFLIPETRAHHLDGPPG